MVEQMSSESNRLAQLRGNSSVISKGASPWIRRACACAIVTKFALPASASTVGTSDSQRADTSVAMASRSTPALKAFQTLDTSGLQPSISTVLEQIEAIHDEENGQKDTVTSSDLKDTEILLKHAKSAIKTAQNFVEELIQFADGCQDDAKLSKAIKEQDSTRTKAILQDLIKGVENAVSSIDRLDAIVGKISDNSLSKVKQHSVDAQAAEYGKGRAKYVGIGIGIAAAGGLVTSAVLGVVALGVGVGGAVLSAAGLGVGTTATAVAAKKYSKTMEKSGKLKEKYSCVSKSAVKVQELVPELKTVLQLLIDKLHQWNQSEEVVKILLGHLKELKSACKVQRSLLTTTQERLSEL